ncbi:hypothetical protein [Streptomyces flavofungini]|uniref:hypothetical protein n=1 Tax=Streptomyces flavofungini TaxID=68200 RepID=UPI0025B09B20|nr:hypothetical protein [Streptomyces flavofungini]WJV47803.1 hypothetical protein QUY26_21170 [Streptomyces flavofungini]
MPSVIGGLTTGLPFRYLVPLLPTLLVLNGQARTDRVSESVAARPVRRMDACLAVGMVACMSMASVVVPDGVAVARNLAGYLGFALLVRWLSTPQAATGLTAFLPFAVVSIGGNAGQPAWWAWPLQDGDAPLAASCAALLFATGLALSFRPPLLRERGHSDTSGT